MAGVASLLVVAVGVWVISPRFALQPSLVDDWSAISKSPGQVHDIFRFAYHDGGRFRPAFAVWNDIQWHTLGAPAGMVGPNVWNIARLSLLVTGLVALTLLLLSYRRPDLRGVDVLVLVALPPLLVVTTPGFGVDLAAFGPQEPALVGGMALGGTLLFLGARELARSGTAGGRARIFGLLTTGYALWLYGVYQKESAVCVVLFIPFVALGSGRRLGQLKSLGRRRRLALAGIAAAVALPIVHVAVETIVIASRGELVYGMHLQGGGSIEHFTRAIGSQMTFALGSHIGWALLYAVCAGILAAILRGRPDWAMTGFFVTGLGVIAWSAQSGFDASRYYIPTIALLAVALGLLLSSFSTAPRWLAIGVVVGFAVASVSATRARVVNWELTERDENGFVAAVADAKATGCPVVITGLDIERTIALPVLVALREGTPSTCSDGSLFLGYGSYHPDPALASICLPQGRRLLKSVDLALEHAVLIRCAGITPGKERLVARSQLS